MRMYLLSDNIDTQIGMRLAGVDGRLIKSGQSIKDAFGELCADKSIAVILVTEKLADMYSECINDFKMTHNEPLVVEIPDRHGTMRPANPITSYVTDAIGLKL